MNWYWIAAVIGVGWILLSFAIVAFFWGAYRLGREAEVEDELQAMVRDQREKGRL